MPGRLRCTFCRALIRWAIAREERIERLQGLVDTLRERVRAASNGRVAIRRRLETS